jgi:hypothetical protein
MWHAWGRGEIFTGFFFGRPEGKRPLGRRRHRWGDNIKIDLREIVIVRTNWIQLAQWRAFVNIVMNLRVP